MTKTILICVAALLVLAPTVGAAGASDIDLASVFSDHMVLQRDEAVTVWGTAQPGTKVTVEFATQTEHAKSKRDGLWSVSFPAMAAGGPYELSVSAKDAETYRISDILVGNVWLCSGQSNMEMPVSRVRSSAAALRRKHSPTIRLLAIKRDLAHQERENFTTKPTWTIATSESLPEFSALCYFFGRELQKEDATPLGLINSSWGGSQLEAWVQDNYLRASGDFGESLDILRLHIDDPKAAEAALGTQWEAWREATSNDPVSMWKTDPAAVDGWKAVPQVGSWKTYGDPQLENYDGLVWFRTTFELSAEQAAGDAELALGRVHKDDAVWLNGQFVGRGYGWDSDRRYDLPADALVPGANHLMMNIRSMWWLGGLTGPASSMTVTPEAGDQLPIADGWEYKIDTTPDRFPPPIPWESVFGLTGMYNAMIAPLKGLKFHGAIWYQGESNTRRAWLYGDTLKALISNWRDDFGDRMPFLVVQLPEFGSIYTTTSESDWSNLREQQRQVAVADPDTGLVVAMGIGDPTDIHPTNKQDLAKRTLRAFRGLRGDAEAQSRSTGFTPQRVYRRDKQVVVAFTPLENGYVVRSANEPIAFELCEDESARCIYAHARLDGHSVILESDNMDRPTSVRYCWGNSPLCNLYTAEGLPVGPFEIKVDYQLAP